MAPSRSTSSTRRRRQRRNQPQRVISLSNQRSNRGRVGQPVIANGSRLPDQLTNSAPPSNESDQQQLTHTMQAESGSNEESSSSLAAQQPDVGHGPNEPVQQPVVQQPVVQQPAVQPSNGINQHDMYMNPMMDPTYPVMHPGSYPTYPNLLPGHPAAYPTYPNLLPGHPAAYPTYPNLLPGNPVPPHTRSTARGSTRRPPSSWMRHRMAELSRELRKEMQVRPRSGRHNRERRAAPSGTPLCEQTGLYQEMLICHLNRIREREQRQLRESEERLRIRPQPGNGPQDTNNGIARPQQRWVTYSECPSGTSCPRYERERNHRHWTSEDPDAFDGLYSSEEELDLGNSDDDDEHDDDDGNSGENADKHDAPKMTDKKRRDDDDDDNDGPSGNNLAAPEQVSVTA